ncbi:hypothetical protein [Pseudoalteromonas denitrificans]|uniref:Uncharacterized protein n=1 Tax=Pseudoalteromonas denitrificans DSM 6059 TaxID=1123010 RepID=A0A1I1SSA0_9GAMM|nr:hypothetical protein [Pseudoalteromonas denitrificans]SFD49201.1 hypothetical protein SAMN02745724_04671 [Pseudoalteromonas denitrificans DSM 6059]
MQISNDAFDNERRHDCPTSHLLWSKLSDAQKASVSSLYNYGYELSFIRRVDCEEVVVLLLNDSPATVDIHGEINTSPDIKVRS